MKNNLNLIENKKVDERLPAGLKTMSKLLFPKSALLFEEESWNCYPSTRTKYSHKLFKSFNVDIESKYLADLGQSDNVFNLSPSELSQRTVGKNNNNKYLSRIKTKIHFCLFFFFNFRYDWYR